jgi:hypothetical protein
LLEINGSEVLRVDKDTFNKIMIAAVLTAGVALGQCIVQAFWPQFMIR